MHSVKDPEFLLARTSPVIQAITVDKKGTQQMLHSLGLQKYNLTLFLILPKVLYDQPNRQRYDHQKYQQEKQLLKADACQEC